MFKFTGKLAHMVTLALAPEVKVKQPRSLLKNHSLKRVMTQTIQGPVSPSQYAEKQLHAQVQTLRVKKRGETIKVPTRKTATVGGGYRSDECFGSVETQS